MNRIAKQIFIAVVFLSFLGGIVYAGLNSILPERELEIIAEQPKKDIKILWAKFLPSGNGEYNLAAQIENPNVEFGASCFNYEFIFYNKNGKVIDGKKGKGYIFPDETKYILEMLADVSSGFSKMELKISDVVWQKSTESPQLKASKVFYIDSIYDLSGAYSEVSGVLVNQSSYNYDEVVINIVLYNQAGNVISVNKTGLNTFLTKEERAFKALWYDKINEPVNRVDVIAETNVYNKDNLIQIKGEDYDALRD